MKKIYIAAAVALAPLYTFATPVGGIVKVSDTLNCRVLTVNGHKHTAEIMSNPDNKPSGALDIPYMIIVGEDEYVMTSVASSGFKTTDITSVKIPRGLTSIGSSAFNGCTKLKTITEVAEEGSIITIGENAFRGTLALESLSLPACAYVGDWSFMISGVKSVNLPKAWYIGAGAFQECKLLETVLTGDALTEVGGVAFCNCPELKHLMLGPNLRKVGPTAFALNVSLEDIVLPRSLSDVGHNAFTSSAFKRMWILTPNIMDFIDSGDVIDHSNLTELYCLPSLTNEIAYYIEHGGEENTPEKLPDVTPKSMNEIIRPVIKSTEGSFRFTLTQEYDGISLLNVYAEGSDTPIHPYYGEYSTEANKVILDYYIDVYNRLNYDITLDQDSEVSTLTTLSGGITVAGNQVSISVAGNIQILDLSGRIVASGCNYLTTSLPAGLYIISTSAGTRKVIIQG